MFLAQSRIRGQSARFPRVRGDVPALQRTGQTEYAFSPRARGCSDRRPHHPTQRRRFPRVRGDVPQEIIDLERFTSVFPACAGMFPKTWTLTNGSGRFPRVRGDVPLGLRRVRKNPKFSPRARGCSALLPEIADQKIVFPACAGMFRATFVAGFLRNRFPRVRGDVPTPLQPKAPH